MKEEVKGPWLVLLGEPQMLFYLCLVVYMPQLTTEIRFCKGVILESCVCLETSRYQLK